ncbi:MAG: hypothetical protein WCP57_13110 [Bacteroidota bacterium]
MNFLLSRFGGHGVVFGKGKASDENLPEDQSFEYLLENHATSMNDFTYLSSYQAMYDPMGPYKSLPERAIKIADIEHDFTEIMMQFQMRVKTRVYMVPYIYCNIFAIFLKTDYSEIEDFVGRLKPSYDFVMITHFINKSEKEIKLLMPEILHKTLLTLIFEMDIKEGECEIIPAKNSLAKKIDLEKLTDGIDMLQDVESPAELATLLTKY